MLGGTGKNSKRNNHNHQPARSDASIFLTDDKSAVINLTLLNSSAGGIQTRTALKSKKMLKSYGQSGNHQMSGDYSGGYGHNNSSSNNNLATTATSANYNRSARFKRIVYNKLAN